MNKFTFVVVALTGSLLVGAVVAAPQSVPGPSARYGHSMAYDSQRQVVVLFGGNSNQQWPSGALNDTWEWDGISWTQRMVPSPPSPRGHGAMVYDSSRGVCVFFGGFINGGQYLSDTWEYDGITWVQNNAASHPSARHAFNMVYDSIRHRTVLFGGWDGVDLDDTWEYDGVNWVEVVTPLAPPPRAYHSAVFDTARGEVVLLGGGSGSSSFTFGDTWAYDGATWVDRNSSPGVRRHAAMAWMLNPDKAVAFGGWSQGNLGDTWEWDGANWSHVASALAPDSRHWLETSMVYDAARNECVLFGGFNGSQTLGDTWTFDGAEWHPKLDYVTSPVNGNRYAITPPMTWQEAESLAVLEGGHLATIRNANEQAWIEQQFGVQSQWFGFNDKAVEGQWEWSSGESVIYTHWWPNEPNNGGNGEHAAMLLAGFSGQWHDNNEAVVSPGLIELPGGPIADVTATLLTTTATPAPVREHAVASLASGGALLFGGETSNSPLPFTYELQGTDWSKQFSFINPMVRTGHTLLLDQARQTNMMFGGENPLGTKLADTWTYANGQWSYLTPTNAPSPRSHHAMAYDPTTDTGILFGGEDMFATAIGDMWQWNGTDWTQAAPATLPPARMRHSIVWDRLRDVLVLFGGTDGTTRLDDVWEWDGTDWSQITPAQPSGFAYGPDPRDGFVMAYDPLSQRVVVIGGETDNGCVDDFWSWDGIAWVRHFATVGSALPSARKGAQIFFDASANELRLHGGGCGSNYSDELWSFQLPVFARSEVIGVGCAGSNGVPTLDIVNGTTPVIGTTVDFLYSNALNSTFVTPAIVAVGFDQSSYQGIPLPLPLAVIGLPGCTLYHSNDVSVSVGVAPGAAQFTWSLGLPNSANFLGQEMFVQGLHLEFPGAGSWAALSNAVGIRIGDQ
jgi:hypothetical protein